MPPLSSDSYDSASAEHGESPRREAVSGEIQGAAPGAGPLDRFGRYRAGVSFDPAELNESMLEFLTAKHLATLTTLRPDGTPHVVPVGFTYVASERRIRIVTRSHSRKARNASAGSTGLVCQFDGGRWLTLQGQCELHTDEASTIRCGELYEARYGHPPRRPGWASLEIIVDRCFGRV
jgi:hypothetical protein